MSDQSKPICLPGCQDGAHEYMCPAHWYERGHEDGWNKGRAEGDRMIAQVGEIRAREDRREWLQIFCALISPDVPPAAVRTFADDAFELYRKRWPR